MRKSKKNDIVEVGTALFSEFGIKRVTVEEICEKAETSKATFYKYFANKNQLVLHIVTTLYQEGSDRFKQKIDQGASFADLVREIFIMKLEFMKVFSQHFLMDLYDAGIPELEQSLLKMQKESLASARPLYEMGIQDGQIDKAVTFEYFLYLLNQVQQAYTDESVIAIYPDHKERLQVTFNQFFFGLMGRGRMDE